MTPDFSSSFFRGRWVSPIPPLNTSPSPYRDTESGGKGGGPRPGEKEPRKFLTFSPTPSSTVIANGPRWSGAPWCAAPTR